MSEGATHPRDCVLCETGAGCSNGVHHGPCLNAAQFVRLLRDDDATALLMAMVPDDERRHPDAGKWKRE